MILRAEKVSFVPFSISFSILLLLLSGVSSYVDYDGYKLLRITPTNTNQIILLREMRIRLYSETPEVDFWGDPRTTQRSIIVSTSPSKLDEVSFLLDQLMIPYKVVLENLKEMIDNQMEQYQDTDGRVKEFESVGIDDFTYNTYHPYTEINEWMKNVKEMYPKLVSLDLLTESYEGKSIYIIRVSGNKESGKKKLAAYIQSGTHAREWIGPATVIYFINQLLTLYEKDEDVTTMMDAFDWYIVPLHNIDGYAYSWETDRLWRKTRSLNYGSTCIGTDPNRNWDFMWGGEGSSSNPCSEVYHGESPFSEIEVRKAAEFVSSKNQEFVFFWDIHSYSQLLLSPYGYTTDLPPDLVEQMQLLQQVALAIKQVFGTEYLYGPSSRILYIDCGSSTDWAYGAAKITHSYTIELRPDSDSKFGFLLPEDQIIPTATETFEGLKAAAILLTKKYIPS